MRSRLADLYDGHWSLTGRGVPAADGPDQEVYLPGRNPLLLVKAAGLVQAARRRAAGASGSLSANPFADASDDFFLAFQQRWTGALPGHVEMVRPLAALGKRQVMELGRAGCRCN